MRNYNNKKLTTNKLTALTQLIKNKELYHNVEMSTVDRVIGGDDNDVVLIYIIQVENFTPDSK